MVISSVIRQGKNATVGVTFFEMRDLLFAHIRVGFLHATPKKVREKPSVTLSGNDCNAQWILTVVEMSMLVNIPVYHHFTFTIASALINTLVWTVPNTMAPPKLDVKKLQEAYKHASCRQFYLDYDGTLTPIVKKPEDAKPSAGEY